MHGNVWEWCQDVWHSSYDGAPDDGSAWVNGGDSSRTVLRGGSWLFFPGLCRSAYRDSYFCGVSKYLDIGFRLVSFPPRTLE